MYDHFTLDQLKTFTFTVSAILLVAQLYYLAVLGCIENKISKVFETRANAFTIEHKKLKDHIKMQQMLNLFFNIFICIVCVGTSNYLSH